MTGYTVRRARLRPGSPGCTGWHVVAANRRSLRGRITRRLIEWAWRLEAKAHRHPVPVNLVFAAIVGCFVLLFVLVPVLVDSGASLSLRDLTGSVLVGLGARAMGRWSPSVEVADRTGPPSESSVACCRRTLGSRLRALWATARLMGIRPVVAVLLAAAVFPLACTST